MSDLLFSKNNLFWIICLSFFTLQCNNSADSTSTNEVPSTKTASTEGLFTLLSAEQTNIDFTNQLNDDPLTDKNVLSFAHYYNGAGVAIGDVNNDNQPDIFFSGTQYYGLKVHRLNKATKSRISFG